MYINMTPDKSNKTLHASQDDTTRQFKFKLVNDSQVLDTSGSIPPVIYDVEPNGVEQLLPVNSSTPTTSPIIADIQYPDELREDQEFFERITPTTLKGQAKVKKIKGNTLVWNQLIQNGNFADTSVWTAATPVTFTVQNNIATVTTNTDGDYNIRQLIPMIIGHKYIYFIDCWTDDNTYTEAIIFYGGASDVAICEVPTNNTWASFSGIFTCVSNQYNFIRLRNQKIGITNKFRNVNIIDLTLMFGSGNEPTTVDEFTSLFPLSYYDYNAGSLLSFNGTGIKSVGFNQWDEIMESGSLSGTGQLTVDANKLRTKNYISVIGGETYYFKITSACSFHFWDGNFNYIGNNYVSSARAFSIPSNAMWMKFRTADAYGTEYKNDICINISDPDKNGTYEPYTENTIDLPISTYFPTGMKSAGTVYDELTPNKAITRLGRIVFNGTQTISYQDLGSYRVSYTIPDMEIGPTGATDIDTNVISNYLPSVSNNDTYNKKAGIHRRINGSRQIIIALGESSGANTLELFNAYLQAHPLTVYYPLATPTEEDFESYSLVSEDIEKPLEYDNGFLVCESEGLTTKSGFIPCKIKQAKGDQTLYSQLINLHVERKP